MIWLTSWLAMKAKKSPSRKSSKKDQKGTVEHYNAVLIESLKSDMKMFMEGMEARSISVERELKDFRKDVTGRFGMLELAVTNNSQAIKELKSEMGQMEKRLSDKIDRNNSKLDNHEERITTLEANRL